MIKQAIPAIALLAGSLMVTPSHAAAYSLTREMIEIIAPNIPGIGGLPHPKMENNNCMSIFPCSSATVNEEVNVYLNDRLLHDLKERLIKRMFEPNLTK